MQKIYISIIVALLWGVQVLHAQSEAPLTLTVSQPGTLRALLSEGQYKNTISMILKGKIDVRDIRVLREMSGNQGSLENLDLSEVKIVAYQEPESPDPQATFTTLPMPGVALGVDKAQVEAYEKDHKGTLNEEMSGSEEFHKLLWFDVTDNEALVRCYFISKNGEGELDEFWGFYPQIEKAVEIRGDSFILTDAFVALLTSSGFTTPQPQGDDGFLTYSDLLNMDLSINVSPLSEITGEETDQKILVLMYAPRGEYL